MPEMNQAVLVRGAITVLQYGVLMLLYMFIFRTTKLIWQDMMTTTGECTPKQTAAHPPEHNYYLRVLEAGEQSGLTIGTRFPVENTVFIGRKTDTNNIVVSETFVSAEHAVVQKYKEKFWISDLNSTNGTFVNGQKTEDETPLAEGDKIMIGSVMLRFER